MGRSRLPDVGSKLNEGIIEDIIVGAYQGCMLTLPGNVLPVQSTVLPTTVVEYQLAWPGPVSLTSNLSYSQGGPTRFLRHQEDRTSTSPSHCHTTCRMPHQPVLVPYGSSLTTFWTVCSTAQIPSEMRALELNSPTGKSCTVQCKFLRLVRSVNSLLTLRK